MIESARIYSYYNSNISKASRLFNLFFLVWLIFVNYSNDFLFSKESRFSIFAFSFFLITEIFFYFKISRITPPVIIKNNNSKNIYNSFTIEALGLFVTSIDSTNLIKRLLKKSQVKFILEKADILEKEISFVKIPKESLGFFSFETAKNAKGQYVTTMDIFVSYLLLTEEKTSLLFNKKLKKEEFLNILYWARQTLPSEENIPQIRVSSWGEGIGEQWVSGWTLETGKYMVDITSESIRKKPLLLGREEEYEEAIEALNKGKSIVLVGEPGSGKDTLVESLAYESFMGELGGNLYHKRFYHLLADTLLAGVENQGELEERLDSVIAELAHSGNIIVYIPDFESILGSSTFNTDLSGVLIPYLQKETIKIIASVTPSSYKKFIEAKHTFSSIIEAVKFQEPNDKYSLQMLLQKTPQLERENKIAITYRAIVAASNFAKKYLPTRAMPGAGVTLLEDTISALSLKGKRIVEEQDVIDKIESKTRIAVGVPKAKEKALLLHLEDEFRKYIMGQKDAVFELSEALRRLRTGLNDKTKPISFLFLGPTGVGKTQTAKALSNIYFGGEEKMIRFDMSEYSEEDSVKRFLGGNPDSKGLTDMVFENPYSLVLLDEFEKSNPKIVDLFLQVFDDGRLTDNTGRTVSFVDTIIIATSNAASEYIREEVNKGIAIDKNFQKKLLEFLQEKVIFRPELLNRFDDIIVFEPLGEKEVFQITKLLLGGLSKNLLEKDIVISFDEKTIEKISKEGFDQEFGARPLRRFIQDNIEDLIAQKMLKDEVKRGDKVFFWVDSSNKLQLKVNN